MASYGWKRIQKRGDHDRQHSLQFAILFVLLIINGLFSMSMVAHGVEEGILETQEKIMMERVLNFERKRVTAIMTLARDIAWIDLEAPLQPQIESLLKLHYSQFPVARRNLDHLLGIIHSKHLYNSLQNVSLDLTSNLFQPLYIPDPERTSRRQSPARPWC